MLATNVHEKRRTIKTLCTVLFIPSSSFIFFKVGFPSVDSYVDTESVTKLNIIYSPTRDPKRLLKAEIQKHVTKAVLIHEPQ